MNYIEAMQRLAKYREDKKINGYTLRPAYNFVERLKKNLTNTAIINNDNLVDLSGSLINQSTSNATARLDEEMRSGCALLELEYTEDMQRKTANYEKQMLQIQRKAKDEIDRGTNKPLSQCTMKLFSAIMLGIFSISMFCAGIAISMNQITLGGLVLGAIAISILSKKKTINAAAMAALVSEAKKLTEDYYSEMVLITGSAYEALQARCDNELAQSEAEIKSVVGERVFFLFENTPYNQQEYFIKLGITASCENDFNTIAQECLKADKSEQLVNLQSMIQKETSDSINKSLEKLNQTAQQMHEDAEFRARQQAEHNAQVEKQNERNLANQKKALGEMKTTKKQIEDFEYRMRHQ